MFNVMLQSLYYWGTDIVPILQGRCGQKKNVLISPGFETGTLLLVASRYIDYLMPEYTGGTDSCFIGSDSLGIPVILEDFST